MKNSKLKGYLDFVLTKNIVVESLELGDFQGNSDHKALQAKVQFNGEIVNRVLSQINRRMLKQFTLRY